jgi:hypothetical protein
MNLENKIVIYRHNFYEYNWNARMSVRSPFRHKCHIHARFFDKCKYIYVKTGNDFKKQSISRTLDEANHSD